MALIDSWETVPVFSDLKVGETVIITRWVRATKLITTGVVQAIEKPRNVGVGGGATVTAESPTGKSDLWFGDVTADQMLIERIPAPKPQLPERSGSLIWCNRAFLKGNSFREEHNDRFAGYGPMVLMPDGQELRWYFLDNINTQRKFNGFRSCEIVEWQPVEVTKVDPE